MGMARLLAKSWIVFCLFAGAHSLRLALVELSPAEALQSAGVCAALFLAMGLLFIGGYAAATAHGVDAAEWKAERFIPAFGDVVFFAFVGLSFANQVAFAPDYMEGPAIDAVKAAMHALVPGERAFEETLDCGLDGGRVFASCFAWLLAFIYLASSASRLRLTAGLIRLERARKPEPLGAQAAAFMLGAIAIVGLQLLFVGSIFIYVPCGAYAELGGAVLIGLGPLMLAYAIVAALANLLAMSPE
jgi:hypothetical protein